ncbi:MAG: Dabb family protein [Bacteroidetes bacterium]|nr:MAG: Dabb family protein [Bacteroidota bacterium]
MKNIFNFFLLLMVLAGCQQNNIQEQLAACQQELSEKTEALEAALNSSESENLSLVHTVYLNVKDDISEADRSRLIEGIKTLASIPGVYNLKTGSFKDLGDKRALSEYEVVLQMEFLDEEAYRHYQQDSVHIGFKKSVADLLAGPPATHDFILQ